MKRKLNIKITGTTASGKSAVAYAIKNALAPFGVNVEEICGAEDEPAGVLEADWEDRMNVIGPELSVNIETVRQIRNHAKNFRCGIPR